MIRTIKLYLLSGFIALLAPESFADIYTFIDSNGVLHFTNTPTSTDYKLYIKEKPKKVKQVFKSSQYDVIIKKAQRKYGIDFSLIKAVIKVESGFNPEAANFAFLPLPTDVKSIWRISKNLSTGEI